jgi:hypothetical protein
MFYDNYDVFMGFYVTREYATATITILYNIAHYQSLNCFRHFFSELTCQLV